MLVSYKWLSEFVDLSGETPQTLADKITRSGLEVEGLNLTGMEINNVVVGHVVSRVKHPDADKLSVCQVNVGGEELQQIVCGAPNVAEGQLVPVALQGAVLPGNFKIKEGNLRGQASNGMICSLAELGIEDRVTPKEFAEGIYVFPAGTEIGKNALEALFIDDAIIDIGLTPNRSDCMNMIGVAYEVSAILGRDVTFPIPNVIESETNASDKVTVKVETEKSKRYAARLIENVKIGPSPMWMQAYLMSMGIRPRNNVVDVTNFVMLEQGHPLHAFDFDKIHSKEIVVREAKTQEKLVTLDEVERELQEGQIVITDGSEILGLAGVMGGLSTSVTEETTNILLESAHFEADSIRTTSRKLGLRSDSSARFEKGTDLNVIEHALNRAAQLISHLADGNIAAGIVEFNEAVAEEIKVDVTLSKINGVLGTAITSDQVSEIFSNLKFEFSVQGENFTVSVPTRRKDITISVDLIEEVARLYGYDNVPNVRPDHQRVVGKLSQTQLKRRLVRNTLAGVGMNQAINYSLTSEERATSFSLYETDKIRLMMPLSEERSTLRQSLIPSLIESVKYNVARQNEDVALFEVGSVFVKEEDSLLPNEIEHVAGALTGIWSENKWQGEVKKVDFYVAKGILEALFVKLGVEKMVSYRPAQIAGMHPGRTAEVLCQNKVVGFLGQVHPTYAKKEGIKETYVFELSLEKLFGLPVRQVKFAEIPKFPSMTRDIALVVDKDLPAGEIQKVIEKAGGRLLKEVTVFDMYQGEHMEEGKKSLAFSLRYFDEKSTLTDEVVVEAHNKVLAQVESKCGAKLRG